MMQRWCTKILFCFALWTLGALAGVDENRIANRTIERVSPAGPSIQSQEAGRSQVESIPRRGESYAMGAWMDLKLERIYQS
jgi:hypothetical protein